MANGLKTEKTALKEGRMRNSGLESRLGRVRRWFTAAVLAGATVLYSAFGTAHDQKDHEVDQTAMVQQATVDGDPMTQAELDNHSLWVVGYCQQKPSEEINAIFMDSLRFQRYRASDDGKSPFKMTCEQTGRPIDLVWQYINQTLGPLADKNAALNKFREEAENEGLTEYFETPLGVNECFSLPRNLQDAMFEGAYNLQSPEDFFAGKAPEDRDTHVRPLPGADEIYPPTAPPAEQKTYCQEHPEWSDDRIGDAKGYVKTEMDKGEQKGEKIKTEAHMILDAVQKYCPEEKDDVNKAKDDIDKMLEGYDCSKPRFEHRLGSVEEQAKQDIEKEGKRDAKKTADKYKTEMDKLGEECKMHGPMVEDAKDRLDDLADKALTELYNSSTTDVVKIQGFGGGLDNQHNEGGDLHIQWSNRAEDTDGEAYFFGDAFTAAETNGNDDVTHNFSEIETGFVLEIPAAEEFDLNLTGFMGFNAENDVMPYATQDIVDEQLPGAQDGDVNVTNVFNGQRGEGGYTSTDGYGNRELWFTFGGDYHTEGQKIDGWGVKAEGAVVAKKSHSERVHDSNVEGIIDRTVTQGDPLVTETAEVPYEYHEHEEVTSDLTTRGGGGRGEFYFIGIPAGSLKLDLGVGAAGLRVNRGANGDERVRSGSEVEIEGEHTATTSVEGVPGSTDSTVAEVRNAADLAATTSLDDQGYVLTVTPFLTTRWYGDGWSLNGNVAFELNEMVSNDGDNNNDYHIRDGDGIANNIPSLDVFWLKSMETWSWGLNGTLRPDEFGFGAVISLGDDNFEPLVADTTYRLNTTLADIAHDVTRARHLTSRQDLMFLRDVQGFVVMPNISFYTADTVTDTAGLTEEEAGVRQAGWKGFDVTLAAITPPDMAFKGIIARYSHTNMLYADQLGEGGIQNLEHEAEATFLFRLGDSGVADLMLKGYVQENQHSPHGVEWGAGAGVVVYLDRWVDDYYSYHPEDMPEGYMPPEEPAQEEAVMPPAPTESPYALKTKSETQTYSGSGQIGGSIDSTVEAGPQPAAEYEMVPAKSETEPAAGQQPADTYQEQSTSAEPAEANSLTEAPTKDDVDAFEKVKDNKKPKKKGHKGKKKGGKKGKKGTKKGGKKKAAPKNETAAYNIMYELEDSHSNDYFGNNLYDNDSTTDSTTAYTLLFDTPATYNRG